MRLTLVSSLIIGFGVRVDYYIDTSYENDAYFQTRMDIEFGPTSPDRKLVNCYGFDFSYEYPSTSDIKQAEQKNIETPDQKEGEVEGSECIKCHLSPVIKLVFQLK